jgi:hypothetical protein
MEVAHPHDGVVAKEPADFVAAGALEVDGIAPGSAVTVRDVRPKFPGVITDGPEMVVDDVEDYSESAEVACINEALERVRATVILGYGEEVYAVVTPAAVPGKCGDGHNFDVRHA